MMFRYVFLPKWFSRFKPLVFQTVQQRDDEHAAAVEGGGGREHAQIQEPQIRVRTGIQKRK